MKLLIQQKSEIPIYQQLYNQIVAQIVAKQVQANVCLPSIRVVARQLEISVIPVKSAYEMLEKDGYIYTVAGKGCFVSEKVDEHKQNQLLLASKKVAETVQYLQSINVTFDEAQKLLKQHFEK